jgi:hypothetical protein
LNAILRISREADYGVIDGLRPKIGTARCRSGAGSAVRSIGFRQNRRRIHLRKTISGNEENVEWRLSNGEGK